MDAAQSVFGGAFSFAYDAGGNMTSSLANGSSLSTFGYDGDNHLVSRTGAGGNYTYTYDGNGTLVKRTETGTGAWTVYIGGIYEVTNAGGVTKYYSALGRTVAMRQAGALYWLLADHLGSNSVVTDGIGAVVGSVKYGPYGGVRSTTGVMPTDKLYTGQRREAGDALGLYDYKARFYSTALGRFLGVDPVVANASDPQAWNPYSYVRNNPLRFTDPTGRCIPGMGCPSDRQDEERQRQAEREHDDLVGALLYLAANPVQGPPAPSEQASTNGGSATEQVLAAGAVAEGLTLADPVPGDEVVMAAAVGGTVAVVACVEFCADAIKGIPLFHAAEDGSDVPEELVVPAPYSGSEEERIARHAQEDGGRFEDLNPAELANVVKDTIEKGEQRTGRNGRTIFYNPDEGVIVIRDPGQPWGGTAFEGTEQDFENIP